MGDFGRSCFYLFGSRMFLESACPGGRLVSWSEGHVGRPVAVVFFSRFCSKVITVF